MIEKKPTSEELSALKRLKSGYTISDEMFERLRQAGFVKQLLGGKAVTEKGLRALGLVR